MSFNFVGQISSSKSLFNRALIASSFNNELYVQGVSESEDVKHLKKALVDLLSGETEFFCGDGGTTLRFLALRASREVGTFVLTGSKRLFSRPQEGLVKLLLQLGVEAKIESNKLIIISQGWKPMGDALYVDASKTSQFVSALILSSWNLGFDLHFNKSQLAVSDSYLDMTIALVEELGMKVARSGNEYTVFKSEPAQYFYELEPDMSSMFSLAALGALNGSCRLKNFPKNSLQPDKVFLDLLKEMGANIEVDDKILCVSEAPLKALSCDIGQSPDLFPVLGVVCAFAEGESHLYGAKHLAYKESNRIKKTAELLESIGRDVTINEDGFIVKGITEKDLLGYEFTFDPDKDHRMAMAAGLLKSMGANIKIVDKDVVNKSFPEFWDCVGVQ